MAVQTPDWLSQRGGDLLTNPAEKGLVVRIDGAPQYQLSPIPVGGAFGCEVRQTVNGRRLEGNGTYPTEEDALRGGLEDLRRALGW